MSRRTRLEAENAALIAALSAMNDETAQELAGRMQKCREHRIRRHPMADCYPVRDQHVLVACGLDRFVPVPGAQAHGLGRYPLPLDPKTRIPGLVVCPPQ